MATVFLPMGEEVREEMPDEFCRIELLLEKTITHVDTRNQFFIHLRNTVREAIASSLRVSVDGCVGFAKMRFKRSEYTQRWEWMRSRIPRLQASSWSSPHTSVLSLYEWFRTLAELGFVGGIEWHTPHICQYDYYLHKCHSTLLSRRMDCSEDFDPRRQEGERNHHITLVRQKISRNLMRERHTHHLVDARMSQLEEWRGVVPRRVARFLKEVPPSLMPFLSITEGVIVQEDIRRDSLIDETVEEQTRYVEKCSPAITLGPFTLVGWSSDDVSWRDHLHRRFRGPQYKR